MKNIFALLLLLPVIYLRAQGPPITTGTPVMLGLAGSGIRTFGKFISKENANIYVHPFGIPYNISPKFQVGGIVPFKWITPKGSETSGGLADMVLFAKYQLYKRDGKAKTFRILGQIKQGIPTGRTTSSPKIGSGHYQTYTGIIAGKISSKLGLYADMGYNFIPGPAADHFIYNFSVSVPLLPHRYPQKQLNVLLECNGNYIISPEIHTIFISPGLQLIPGRRILFETSVQIPVLQQNVLSNQTNYMILLGTRFLFN